MTTETSTLPADLEERLRFDTLVADLSPASVAPPSRDVDREIEDAERRVCECLRLDRSALCQSSAETPHVLVHLYRRREGPATPERTDAQEYFPWCQQLLAGKTVGVSSLEEPPPEAARDRETQLHYGIKKSLTFPLSAGGAVSTRCGDRRSVSLHRNAR